MFLRVQLSIDRRFSGVFKAFTTGEDAKAAQTWGSFGVGNVTGRGHVGRHRGCSLLKQQGTLQLQSLLSFMSCTQWWCSTAHFSCLCHKCCQLPACCCCCLLQAFLTNTWACADKIPEDAAVCIDSWTGAQVRAHCWEMSMCFHGVVEVVVYVCVGGGIGVCQLV